MQLNDDLRKGSLIKYKQNEYIIDRERRTRARFGVENIAQLKNYAAVHSSGKPGHS